MADEVVKDSEVPIRKRVKQNGKRKRAGSRA